MSNHFPLRFFLFNCLILMSCLISLSIYAEFDSALLEKLKKENIVDTTQTLSANEIEKLKLQNEQLYQDANVDFKILMIPSTQGETIEQYALDVFNTIKIGNEKLDNGLLLIIAKDDRKMRFEVGYGLEGDFTDIEAGRIIRYDLAPYFKQNQYYDGIQTATDSVYSSVSSVNKDNDLSQTQNELQSNEDEQLSLGIMIFVLILYGISGLILATPLLLLFLYFKNRNKAKTPLPEIVMGTDGQQYIRIKKNRERPFEPYSEAKDHREQKSSSSSTLNPHSTSSSTKRDSGGSSGGGGASGSW